MKLSNKLLLIMVFLSFGIMFKTVVNADWWERGDRPELPRNDVFPTNPAPTGAGPTNPAPTNPAPTASGPTVTPRTGGPQVTPTVAPTGSTSTSSNNDPCANGKSYTGDYCGWSPRIGGNDGGTGDSSSYDPGVLPVLGLSYTAGEEIGLSDIMLLSGILCLSLYAKSKFAPGKIASLPAKKRSR